MKFLFTSLFVLVLSGTLLAQETVDPTTTITFEDFEFDFGEAQEGERITHIFKFTNTGEIPLVITNAKGSCGCTVPYFPKDPIFPGESSEIEVEFNTKGKRGMQSKRITLTANTDPATTFLTIKGEVLKNADDDEELVKGEPIVEDPLLTLNPDCVAIYPNPTSEVLQLKLREYIGKPAEVDIHNDLGQQMLHESIDQISSESTRFDVSRFNPGIYTVTIQIEKMKPFTRCFVVVGN